MDGSLTQKCSWTNKLEFIYRDVHGRLTAHYRAGPFRKPANAKSLVPSYYKGIANPTDLLTIKRRLENQMYPNAAAVIEDYRHMFRKCRQVNRSDSHVFKASQLVERVLDNALARMPEGLELAAPFGGLLADWTPTPVARKKPKGLCAQDPVVHACVPTADIISAAAAQSATLRVLLSEKTLENKRLKQVINEMNTSAHCVNFLRSTHTNLDSLTKEEIPRKIKQLETENGALQCLITEKTSALRNLKATVAAGTTGARVFCRNPQTTAAATEPEDAGSNDEAPPPSEIISIGVPKRRRPRPAPRMRMREDEVRAPSTIIRISHVWRNRALKRPSKVLMDDRMAAARRKLQQDDDTFDDDTKSAIITDRKIWSRKPQ